MKIIVINGSPGAGKDLFVEFAQKNFEDIYNLSVVDNIKYIARTFLSWDGKKDERGRRYLSDIKDAMTRYNDLPLKNVISHINQILGTFKTFEQSTNNLIFFVHCREPNDIEKFVEQYDAKTLLIRRPAVEKQHENHADNNVLAYDYDFTYMNEFDKEQMEQDVISFMNWIRRQNWRSGGKNIHIWDEEGVVNELYN